MRVRTTTIAGWCALIASATAVGCANTTAVDSTNVWLALDAEQRAERLFETASVAPRTLHLGDALIRFVELGPTSVPDGASADSMVPWVLVHGLGGSLGDFAPFAVAAAARHRVMAFDLPGFGQSTALDRRYSIARFSRTLAALLRATDTERAHLVCHSMGGHVCLAFALNAPERVETLTLIDTAGTYSQRAFIERATRGALGSIDPQRDAGIALFIGGKMDILARLLGHDPSILSAISSFKDNYHLRVRDLRVPTLIIWGERDPVFPVGDAVYLMETLRASTLQVVAEAGHSPQLTHATRVFQWVEQFHDQQDVRSQRVETF